MSEGKFVSDTETALKVIAPDMHFSRVESHLVTAGFPDIDYCIWGIEGHMEFKFSRDKNAPEIRPSQVKWFNKRVKAGGNPWIFALLYVNNNWNYALFTGDVMKDLAVLKRAENWTYWAHKIWTGHMTRNNWFNFAEIVTEKKS